MVSDTFQGEVVRMRLFWLLARLGLYSARLPLPVGLDKAGKIDIIPLPEYE